MCGQFNSSYFSHHFLEKILLFKNLENIIHLNKINQKILNFTIQDSLNFYELKSEFLKFRNIPNIDVSIHSNSISNQHLFLFLNYLYLIQR